MWQGKRRLRRLENEVAHAREAQADLQRRVDLFEKIAEAAGAALEGPASPDPALPVPVPPSLRAAAWEPRKNGTSVRITVHGREVIAVIGGEGGDPREWWAAIRQLASRLRSVS